MVTHLAYTVRAATLETGATNEKTDAEVEKADAEALGGLHRTGLHNNLD